MPLRYLLDTNICIYIAKQRPPEVARRFARLSPARVFKNGQGWRATGGERRRYSTTTPARRNPLDLQRHYSARRDIARDSRQPRLEEVTGKATSNSREGET